MKGYYIADSSFYLCFLVDIDMPNILIKIVRNLKFIITPAVDREIRTCKNIEILKSSGFYNLYCEQLNYAELLRPFFSAKQLAKGETEAIALASHFHYQNKLANLILDDLQARKVVINHLSYLVYALIGTIGFIGRCFCDYEIISRENALNLIDEIDGSSFRIQRDTLNSERQHLKTCR
jgi:predicted nucleic acid-binding protein